MNVRANEPVSKTVRKEVGERIRARRKALGLSQGGLGALLRSSNRKPVEAATISRWERGEFMPSRHYWPQIAAVLDLPLDGLIGDLLPSETGDTLLARLEEVETRVAALARALHIEQEVDAAVRAKAAERRLKKITAPAEDEDPQEHSPRRTGRGRRGRADDEDQAVSS